jgi:hypothetical protein
MKVKQQQCAAVEACVRSTDISGPSQQHQAHARQTPNPLSRQAWLMMLAYDASYTLSAAARLAHLVGCCD